MFQSSGVCSRGLWESWNRDDLPRARNSLEPVLGASLNSFSKCYTDRYTTRYTTAGEEEEQQQH